MSKSQTERVVGEYFIDSIRKRRVESLLKLPPYSASQEERERHRIYCYLLLALVNEEWNPFKFGLTGTYPWLGEAQPPRKQYLGHNIACIAVDGRGSIRDFDFNHNEIFNSSIEHAEARLLRRLFTLTHHGENLRDGAEPKLPPTFERVSLAANFEIWNAFEETARRDPDLRTLMDDSVKEVEEAYERSHFGKALKDVTLYTSLESCAPERVNDFATPGGINLVCGRRVH